MNKFVVQAVAVMIICKKKITVYSPCPQTQSYINVIMCVVVFTHQFSKNTTYCFSMESMNYGYALKVREQLTSHVQLQHID